jgi:hypothetical protein
MRPWETLLRRLRGLSKWPPPGELKIRQKLALWAALRESDEPVLRRVMDWKVDRDLLIDNLPEKIATAYGDLLFGEDPDFDSADPSDQPLLDAMVEGWPGGLQSAEETCVSEGEVWWRLAINVAASFHPVLTWHSRADVVALFFGGEPIAVGFVSRLSSLADDDRSKTVWRHIEIHSAGVIVNVLFEGREDQLGEERRLVAHPEVAELAEIWEHGLPILAGRIVNRFGRSTAVGKSIYEGVWTRFLELNEAATIGRENMRLTAKKRAVVPASALRAAPAMAMTQQIAQAQQNGLDAPRPPRPQFDAGEDLLVHDPLDVEEGREGAGPFRILEYSFDAQALIAHYQHVVETVCQRCDIVPQFIGSGDFGAGNSGTALRVRLLPTTNAAEGRGRRWDDSLPVISQRGQLLEALPVALGGFGRDAEWTNPGGFPSVERSSPLPADENERAQRIATLRTADAMSIEESVREQHGDWEDDRVQAEVDAIRADIAANVPSMSFGGTAPPPGSGG